MHNSHTSLPLEFIEQAAQVLNIDRGEVIKRFSIRRPVTIRVNTLLTDLDIFLNLCKTNNITLAPVQWWQNAFVVTNKTTRELTDLPLYKKGLFYIQNLSSMIPALVLAPEKNETVLDMAAAPGSKTTQLSALMENTGQVVANDISRNRIFKLTANLKTYGVNNVSVSNIPAERLWQKYQEYFDKTLLDAPCSMEGRITIDEPETYKNWSVKSIKRLAHKQQWMLRSAVSATKVGGTIVYSTCTLSVAENEAVVDWILEKERGTVILEEIGIPRLIGSPGITNTNSKNFTPQLKKTLRILPSETMEGFYVAKLKKIKSNVRT